MKYKITIEYGDDKELKSFDIIVDHSVIQRKSKYGGFPQFRWMSSPEVKITKLEESDD